MENERVQRYVASLEQVTKNSHLDLRGTMIQFQEYSQRITTERTVSPEIITDIRRTYKAIQDQLTKIRGINQLLEGRYRQHYRRDSFRDKEISEFGILSKNLHSKFESMLQGIEAKRKLKDIEEESEPCFKRISSEWFRSSENQVILLGNLRGLYELEYIYKTRLGVDVAQRQRVIQDKLRSLSLFVLSGEGGVIDILQSRMQLREYDIKERYAKDELRGALTHLKEISVAEVEGVVKRCMDSGEAPKPKCLLLSIQTQEDLGKETLGSTYNILKGMTSGEVRSLQV